VGVRNLFAGTWNVEVVVLACTFEVFFFSRFYHGFMVCQISQGNCPYQIWYYLIS
jgi:hypothetical protein